MQSSESLTKFVPRIKAISPTVPIERITEIEQFIDEWNNDSRAIELMTSGSTGTPKHHLAQKVHLAASAQMTIDFFHLSPGMNLLQCLSISSIAGKMQIIRAIIGKMDIFVSDLSSNPLVDLNDHIDFAAMVPLQVENVLRSNPDKLNLLSTVIIGGAPLNMATWNKIASTGIRAFQTFGMTETYSHIAVRQITQLITPYQLLPGVTIRAEPNLVISAPHLGIKELHTNDIAELIDPQHFNWKGRSDYVINSGGIKIHPELIEFQLGEIITNPFFSAGIPDDQLGTMHILCIEGKAKLNKEDLSSTLKKFEVPKILYFFQKFDYTHSGKIDRINTLKRLNEAIREIL
jgi:O-succinylbenzoic acid--CoA ligase